MSSAKVVSLSVRPFQASHLCFEVGGILGESNVHLGDSVKAFDFSAFYATLGSIPTVAGNPARLLFDFLEIQAFVKPFTLASVRAETGKAALHKAINARANAYYAKYANTPAIIARMNQSYSPSIAQSKPNRLDILSSLSEQQMQQLETAYRADGRTDVVKTTNSIINSEIQSRGTSTTTGRSWSDRELVPVEPQILPTPPNDGAPTTPSFSGGDFLANMEFQEGSTGEKSTSTGTATQWQTIVNTDYGYRIPSLENFAQYERAQISLIDEKFAQFMYSQNLPHLTEVFQNELNSIDSDVFRLQIAYLNTILMSPIEGTVTGIYKNPGEAVQAGETVIRVENSLDILLVARLIFRGPIAIGSDVKVNTALFDASGPETIVAGPVVAVRGQHDDDHWEVVVKCNNLDHAGKPIFPLGYHFDYDDTTVDIS